MNPASDYTNKINILPFVLILLLLVCIFSGFGVKKEDIGYFRSDEANYWGMVKSLIYDRDLAFDKKDLMRSYDSGFRNGPKGVFLTRKDKDSPWYYSKPAIYPIILVPLVALFGTTGIYVSNGLLLFCCIYLGYRHLRKRYDPGPALFISAGFYLIGLPYLYIYLIHPEMWDTFLCAVGVFLIVHPMSEETLDRWVNRWPAGKSLFRILQGDGRILLAATAFSLVAYNKFPNAFILGPLIIWYVYTRRDLKKTLAVVSAALLPALLFLTLEYIHSGDFNPKGGKRYYFRETFPGAPNFSVPDKPRGAYGSLGDTLVKFSNTLPNLEIFTSDLFYFFLGRYSGMIWYQVFPFLIFITILFRYKPPLWQLVLTSIIGTVLLWITLFPTNYFGGGGTLGNRYFLPMMPMFLYLFPRIDQKKAVIFSLAGLTLSFLFLSPLLSDPVGYFYKPDKHTRNIRPFIWAPLELTLYRHLSKRRSNMVYGAGYEIYFHDDLIGKTKSSPGFFWLTGKGAATCIIKSRQKSDKLILDCVNPGGKVNDVKIKVGGQSQQWSFAPNSAHRFVFTNFRQFTDVDKFREIGDTQRVRHLTKVKLDCSQSYSLFYDLPGKRRQYDPRGLYVKLPRLAMNDTSFHNGQEFKYIKITPKENSDSLLVGWSKEKEFFWLNGLNAVFAVFDPLMPGDYELVIEGEAYHPLRPLTVNVYCEGQKLGTMIFDERGVKEKSCIIPAEYIPTPDNPGLAIQLTCDKVGVPAVLNKTKSKDTRELSLRVEQIRFRLLEN